MFKKVRVFLFFFAILLSSVNSTSHSSEEPDEEEFVPTTEWQQIKEGNFMFFAMTVFALAAELEPFPYSCRRSASLLLNAKKIPGQKIPRGLHVRINFQTGVKEAKLLDPNNNDKRSLAVPILADNNNNEIKTNKPPNSPEKFIRKFHSYEELKRKLDEVNLTPKFDTELLRETLNSYREVKDKKEKLKLIKELEYLTHQYDNAVEFVRHRGFDIIYKNLNQSDDSQIKIYTLKLLTAITQNNILTKNYALDTGAISMLLRVINFDKDSKVLSSAIVALGSLLRSFVHAQISFVANGGFAVFSKIFANEQEGNDVIKVQLKIATLISDILVDAQWGLKDDNLKEIYADFNLEDRVVEENWCENLNKLLNNIIATSTKDDDDDDSGIEKCLEAMNTLALRCRRHFNQHLISNLSNAYRDNDRDDDEFATTTIPNLCKEILLKLNTPSQDSHLKAEL